MNTKKDPIKKLHNIARPEDLMKALDFALHMAIVSEEYVILGPTERSDFVYYMKEIQKVVGQDL